MRKKFRTLVRRVSLALLAVLLLCAFVRGAVADMSDASNREITHLLEYVGASGCDFYRNGTWHTAIEGRDHLQQKLDYAKGRGLETAEQFIEKVATGSSFSGRPYRVRCQGTEATAAQWLDDELQRYRAGARDGTRAGATTERVPAERVPAAPADTPKK